jgi:hypothetical protein
MVIEKLPFVDGDSGVLDLIRGGLGICIIGSVGRML